MGCIQQYYSKKKIKSQLDKVLIIAYDIEDQLNHKKNKFCATQIIRQTYVQDPIKLLNSLFLNKNTGFSNQRYKITQKYIKQLTPTPRKLFFNRKLKMYRDYLDYCCQVIHNYNKPQQQRYIKPSNRSEFVSLIYQSNLLKTIIKNAQQICYINKIIANDNQIQEFNTNIYQLSKTNNLGSIYNSIDFISQLIILHGQKQSYYQQLQRYFNKVGMHKIFARLLVFKLGTDWQRYFNNKKVTIVNKLFDITGVNEMHLCD